MPSLDFWFEFASTYSYPAAMRIEAAAHADGPFMVWDWQSSRQVAALSGHAGQVSGMAFSPDGKLLATASHDGTAKLWDVARGRLLATFAPDRPVGRVWVAVFTPDGKTVVTAGDDKVVRFWGVSDAVDRPAPRP